MNSLNPENSQGVIQKLYSLFGNNAVDWVEVDFSTWSESNKDNHNFEQAKKGDIDDYPNIPFVCY